MKIRAIRLRNVRRFASRKAELTDIGDGVTTVCEPNETGKSTFFDSLHAVLFFDHKTTAAEIRSLQPYSKGAVEISADIEIESGQFRIAKSFLAARSATITNLGSGQIIAQAGEAEAWIEKAIGTDMTGPAGLLWVKQGTTGFGPGGSGPSEKREREKMRDTRQTLMSTVAGHIDSVTGGRRMDSIMRAVAADLDALATKNLGPKASGEWGKATARMEELTKEQTFLQCQVDELSDALAERFDLKVKLGDARSASDDAARAARTEELAAEIEKAREHGRKVEAAARDLRIAELELSAIEDQIADIKARAARSLALKATQKKAKATLDAGTEELAGETALLAKAQIAHTVAVAVLKEVRQADDRDRLRARQAASEKRRLEINQTLARVQGYRDAQTAALARIEKNPVDAAAIKTLDSLLRDQSRQDAAAAASASLLRVTYSGAKRLTSDGKIIAEGEDYPITCATMIDLPGIGSIGLRPANEPQQADVGSTGARLRDHLDALGVDSPAAARARHEEYVEQTRLANTAQNSLDTLVPSGTQALSDELDRLPAVAEQPPAEDADGGAAISLEGAEARESAARDAMEEIRGRRDAVNGRVLQAQTALKLATDAVTQDAAPGRVDPPGDLEARADEQRTHVEQVCAAHVSLAAQAPDLEILEAERERLDSARRNAQARRADMQKRVSELDGLINARAGDGVEARLAEVGGELEKATARADRYGFDVKVLDLLRRELEQSRSAAQDAYFEPVKAELGPLLSMLHDHAEIDMDSETMLPCRLKRGAVEDDFDVLSGGAAEQVAILTRLAFAKLYAKQGRAVPVILDDALVHSDDDRIVKMFTALTRISKDQQIIVFSCRSRAFEDLGGHRPQIRIEAVQAVA